MKKILCLFLILSVISIISFAEEVYIGEKSLKLLKVKSPTSFEFEEIGFARLAGVSGMRSNDEQNEEATKITSDILKNTVDKDGKLNIKIYKDEKKYKDGKTRVYYYVIIPIKDSSLEHILVSKGIASVNSHTKKYFKEDTLKTLEKIAKEKKLFKWK
ncbi:MAG: hypothetical protein C0601_05065 [Candidatus Muiribacterium halophilum]|uniref:TNase-like domain-containing protein n=1 Tax=Muiribacterium halophilum TaxID=2053465 RepID=A0A2N5ZIF4_MUIH1|nr:MAG: hypothetical protein C0601_05065 [Candidatus Muirbacterium halophilum]